MLTQAIGQPLDYEKNKEHGSFSEYTDLRILLNEGLTQSDTLIPTQDIEGLLSENFNKMALDGKPGTDLNGHQFNENLLQSEEATEMSTAMQMQSFGPASSLEDVFTPIKALSHFSSDWCIRVRILKRSELRSYKNEKGEGVLLNMDLIDREGTMIQATAFGEVAEELDGLMVPNELYTIAGGAVKMANRKYTPIKNDHCLILGSGTQVKKCTDDSKRIAFPPAFSFTRLSEIEDIAAPCALDVIGVILNVQPKEQIVTRDDQLRDKQTLTIGDESNTSIELTLWGETCECQDFQEGQVVAFQNCRVSNFSGKSLNASWDVNDVILGVKHPRFV